MQIIKGNIAVTIAILHHALEVNKMMNNSVFHAELTYQVTMLYVKALLSRGLLSIEQCRDFQEQMQTLYSPLFSKYMDETLDK